MNVNLPSDVKKILNKLETAGFEAYAVGGCIRDALLSRVPNDWDITTSASPYEVKKLFDHTIDTGIQHGTVTVMLNHVGYEVTTYRVDGEYEDCRHPKEVTFTNRLSEDLLRRDFTINAMAYNEKEGLVDLFGGCEDLKNKVIRCVGDATERFSEDALRILRAFRFAAQLGFSVDEATKQAARLKAPNLSKVSAERIRVELNKLLLSVHPDKLMEAKECNVTKVVFPEFDEIADLRFAVECVLEAGRGNGVCDDREHKTYLSLKWASLIASYYGIVLHRDNIRENLKEEMCNKAYELMARYKFDNDTRDRVVKIVSHLVDEDAYDNEQSVRSLMRYMGTSLCPAFFELRRAILITGSSLSESDAERERLLKEAISVLYSEEIYKMVVERGDCVEMCDLAVTGQDLIRAGVPKGPEIGRILDKLLSYVILHPEKNHPEFLMNYFKSLEENER